MSVFGVLTVIFVVLKILEIITWSWWLVLLPLYGGIVLVLGFIVLMAIIGAILGGKS